MTSNTDPFFETRLLSRRNTVSVSEKEAVLESVLEQTRRAEKQRLLSRFFLPGPWRRVVAVMLLPFMLIPVVFAVLKGAPEDEFRAKGAGRTASFFSVFCFDTAGKTPCRQGGKLAFKLHPEQNQRYFAAFAQRASDGLVYWFFPSRKTEKSVSLRNLEADGILSQGMVIDDTYTPGRYQVFGLLSNTPLDRQEIRESVSRDPNDNQKTLRVSTVFFTVER